MTLTKNVNPLIYTNLSENILNEIAAYIDDSATATTFSDDGNGPSREIITSEIIYYWMIKIGIPFECQKWHINRLITLIRICEIKESPNKKMGKQEILNRNRALNDARRAKMNTKG